MLINYNYFDVEYFSSRPSPASLPDPPPAFVSWLSYRIFTGGGENIACGVVPT